MSTGVALLLSPVTIAFCRRKSTRLTAVMGGLITALGCLFTSFATQFHQLFFSYGTVIGKRMLTIKYFISMWRNSIYLTTFFGNKQRTKYNWLPIINWLLCIVRIYLLLFLKTFVIWQFRWMLLYYILIYICTTYCISVICKQTGARDRRFVLKTVFSWGEKSENRRE